MLKIADTTFTSRLFTGTGKFATPTLMAEAIKASGSQLVTMAMKRVDLKNGNDDLIAPLKSLGIKLLPNTSGAKTAQEAVFAARLAKEALETLKAAELLVKEGFVVLPYCSADPVLCRRLEEVGCAAVMPLGSPIGSNQGLQTRDFLRIIIEQTSIPVVVDAGIGAPSHALEALELGADAVLVNTAIAVAKNPVLMAQAFKAAIDAGELARQSGLAVPTSITHMQAQASSPLTQYLEAF